MATSVNEESPPQKISLPAELADVKHDWTSVSSTSSRRSAHYSHRGDLRTASSGRREGKSGLRIFTPRGSLGEIDQSSALSPIKPRQSLSPKKPVHSQFLDRPQVDSQASIPNGKETEVKPGEGDQMRPLDCPLNAEHFPPIGEIDHKVGRCYCYLCTCGIHICPMAYQRARLNQTFTATSYRSDYRKKECSEPAQKYVLKPMYVPNSQPIDLLTTSQRDFQPFTVSSPLRTKPSTAPNPLKFNFRSSYQAEFPNWGANSPPGERRPVLPYRGGEVKMDLKTTYSKEFTARKRTEDPVSHLGSTTGSTVFAYPLSTKVEFYGETTARKAFRSPKRLYVSKQEKPTSEQHALSESPKKIHFQTKYQSDFQGLQQAFRPPPRANYLA